MVEKRIKSKFLPLGLNKVADFASINDHTTPKSYFSKTIYLPSSFCTDFEKLYHIYRGSRVGVPIPVSDKLTAFGTFKVNGQFWVYCPFIP